MNYDPSAGIDSDCRDVSGDLPSIQQNAEEEPSLPEQAVTVKVILCLNSVLCSIGYRQYTLFHEKMWG